MHPVFYFIKTVDGVEGNCLVGFTIQNQTDAIRWSWHLWVTNYDPDDGGTTYSANGYEIMDRNLGAKSVAVPTETMGLYYQWGRKDPFPRPQSFTAPAGSSSTIPLYKEQNTPVPISRVNSGTLANPLNSSVTSPTMFIYNGNAVQNYDWMGANRNDNLWNDISGQKTIWDPCPEGWRIPAKQGAGEGNYSITPWRDKHPPLANGDNGVTINGMGYYPLNGMYRHSDGLFELVNLFGSCWMANANGVKAYCLSFDRGNVYHASAGLAIYRARGYPARCVKD